jgi:hypothetical protein
MGFAGDRSLGVPPLKNLVQAALVLPLSWAALKVALNFKRKQRLLDDTPTSKALGVFIGEVEVVGVCVSEDPKRPPFISYLAMSSCVYYRWEVGEHYRRGLISGVEVVASGCKAGSFHLKDETGFILVNPAGAEIVAREIFYRTVSKSDPLYYAKGPGRAVEGSTDKRTFTEHALTVGMKVFIHGRASERPDVVAAQIACEKKADIFSISYRGEGSIREAMSWKAMGWHFTGWFLSFSAVLVACVGLGPVFKLYFGFFTMITDDHHHSETLIEGWAVVSPCLPHGIIIGVSLYLLAWVVGWIWMAFNSIIGLRNRVAQAYSLIDVQLKRRTDLIGRFVACVKGFREHEASVQTLVTAMRAQAGGGAVKALAPSILAVIESYPEIRTLALFNDLSKQLIETEDRIALARGYHNNIATFYNTRLERVPDCYVAGLVKMKPEALFEAEGFTYHPATVAF